MKVRVTLVVDIDPDAYRREYWSDESNAEVREYTRNAARDAVEDALRVADPKASVTVAKS